MQQNETHPKALKALTILLFVWLVIFGAGLVRQRQIINHLTAQNAANDGAATECEQRSGLVPNR